MVEHLAVNQGVVGSSPTVGAIFLGVTLKNIVILSNNRKKALLFHFCESYREILSGCRLFATCGTSRVISNVGLKVFSFLSGPVGGYHQIMSKIQCGEVDMVFFFRDASRFHSDSSLECELLRICDFFNVPTATNVFTAEILIRSLISDNFE